MKTAILKKVRSLEEQIKSLKKLVSALSGKQVSKKEVRTRAETCATYWVENVRSPLEHKAKLEPTVIKKYADHFRQLHVLSRPNNLKTSYMKCLSGIMKSYKDDLELPLLQAGEEPVPKNEFLESVLKVLPDHRVSDYLREAISCAEAAYYRAAIVLGWCAVIDCIQEKVIHIGLNEFNKTSLTMKSATSGRFKRFSKEFKLTGLSDLQEVFDNDLIWIVEGMGLVDANQADRLRICFQWRNQSAHPSQAPIDVAHLNAFFSDIVKIVLNGSAFTGV